MLVDMQEGNEECGEDENSEEESEDESNGIDLMASNGEEDEEEFESESENKKDRVSLDVKVSENNLSVYWRLNVELDKGRRQEQRQRREEITDCEDILFREAQISDNKVLYELEEKLNAYNQELPVLGFNSGKYDLNAVKEFLFPYLIKMQPIKFTVKRNCNHMCLKKNFLKFLDISNYLAPRFSYDQFLKAYECEQTKGAVLGAWDSIASYASKETMDQLIGSYKQGKYLQGVFGKAVKDFNNSEEALKQGVAMKYQNYLSRHKFKLVCKTQSSVYDADKKI